MGHLLITIFLAFSLAVCKKHAIFAELKTITINVNRKYHLIL